MTAGRKLLSIELEPSDALSQEIYELLLGPYWAEEYAKSSGAPGIPGRLQQFMQTRARAIARLEDSLGVPEEYAAEVGFGSFLDSYQNGLLPIRCCYRVDDLRKAIVVG